MRIAVFEHQVVTTNAIGRMTRMIVKGLSEEHQFTVFAIKFDNPCPEKIEFVRVPALPSPLFVQFVTFHLLAPLVYLWHKWRHSAKFDQVMITDVNVFMRGIFYTHFCHVAYMREHWQATRPQGLRRLTRWLDHKLHALSEPIVFRMARTIIVPSQGLAREIEANFGGDVGKKMHVIGNAVDVEKMRPPSDFDQSTLREEHGFKASDLVLSFVALGHFERKGLPLLMEAIQATEDEDIKLLVIGGTRATIEEYQRRADRLGILKQVCFVGMQEDIRPYLWMSDVFAFPSAYETFSVATFEASAAGLPVLVSHLYGVEDYVVDGENGWVVERNKQDIARILRQLRERRGELPVMGARGAAAVKAYDFPQFIDQWHAFFTQMQPGRSLTRQASQPSATHEISV
jgi:glycosyltransferase involved in cell wall biosynthesis